MKIKEIIFKNKLYKSFKGCSLYELYLYQKYINEVINNLIKKGKL